MADTKFNLTVKAGPTYKDLSNLEVNSEKPFKINSPECFALINIRIKNYNGPYGTSKSDYFQNEESKENTYCLEFIIKFKNPISSDDLLLGNDFDDPIRDILPRGTSWAFSAVKYFIDPGLEGDAYADKPYLYSPAISSLNKINIIKSSQTSDFDFNYKLPLNVKENTQVEEINSFDSHDSQERKKYFLKNTNRKSFIFNTQNLYECEFANGFIDMSNGFALKIPWITVNVMQYANNRPLRYVLKSRDGSRVFFVIQFVMEITNVSTQDVENKNININEKINDNESDVKEKTIKDVYSNNIDESNKDDYSCNIHESNKDDYSNNIDESNKNDKIKEINTKESKSE